MVMSKQLHILYTVTNELDMSTHRHRWIRGSHSICLRSGYLYYRSHLCHLETKIEVREGSAASGKEGCFDPEISWEVLGGAKLAMLCFKARNLKKIGVLGPETRPLVGTKRQTISQSPSHQSPLGPVAALQGTKHIFLTMGSGHPYPTMPAFTNVSFSNLTWLLMSLMSDASHS